MPILNPRRLTAALPTQRVDNQPVVPENIHLQVGADAGAGFEVIIEEGSSMATREGSNVVFDLEAMRPLLPTGVFQLSARTVEARPDIVTDEFPEGIDLLSTWATPIEVAVANPPMAPALSVE